MKNASGSTLNHRKHLFNCLMVINNVADNNAVKCMARGCEKNADEKVELPIDKNSYVIIGTVNYSSAGRSSHIARADDKLTEPLFHHHDAALGINSHSRGDASKQQPFKLRLASCAYHD